MQKDLKEQFVRCIELMQSDVAEFEAKYQGRFAEEPHAGLGNRKTRCVNEATLPIITCHPSCLEKCAGTCYVINICTKPRPNCRRVEARNTVLRRIDPNAYYEHFYREAERLHLPIRLSDGGDFENAEQMRIYDEESAIETDPKEIAARDIEENANTVDFADVIDAEAVESKPDPDDLPEFLQKEEVKA